MTAHVFGVSAWGLVPGLVFLLFVSQPPPTERALADIAVIRLPTSIENESFREAPGEWNGTGCRYVLAGNP